MAHPNGWPLACPTCSFAKHTNSVAQWNSSSTPGLNMGRHHISLQVSLCFFQDLSRVFLLPAETRRLHFVAFIRRTARPHLFVPKNVFYGLTGWRPSPVGWRPSKVCWRPSLLGRRPLLITRLEALLGWRPSLVGWRVLTILTSSSKTVFSVFLHRFLRRTEPPRAARSPSRWAW